MTEEIQPTNGGGPPKARVFISYSRKDMAFADHLEAALTARGFEPLRLVTEVACEFITM
jgi:hypothetical protein